MRILDALSDWWEGDGSPRTVKASTRERHTRVADGKVVERSDVTVEVDRGVVTITGDLRGLTINGRRVRFKDETPK